jgi:hypothetical protein
MIPFSSPVAGASLKRLLFACSLVVALSPPCRAAGDADAARTKRIDFAQPDWLAKSGLQIQQRWGLENLRVVDAPPGLPAGAGTKCLRASFPAGSASPTVNRNNNAPLGGGQFCATLGLTPTDQLHLRYFVRFAEGFDFVKGGKLPGLYGGTTNTGRRIPDGTDGFSTRFMWRGKGDGEVYAYLPTSEEHGTSLGRGTWRFVPGKWYAIEQRVHLNAPGRDDGDVTVWLDGKQVLKAEGLRFRTAESLHIEGLLFSTFFGGGDPTWATPRAVHIDFADFRTAADYIGPE